MSHIAIHHFILSGAVIALCACASHQTETNQVVAPQPPMQSVTTYNPDNAEIFSNTNVIVYSLDKPVESNKRSFAPHRGVVDNTTSSGYTVFDQSVIVYPLDGASNKPDYLPEYSVPRYAQERPMNEVGQEGIIPAMPADMMPLDVYVPSAPSLTSDDDGIMAEPLPSEPLKEMNVPARRSRPLLTAYE